MRDSQGLEVQKHLVFAFLVVFKVTFRIKSPCFSASLHHSEGQLICKSLFDNIVFGLFLCIGTLMG